MKDSKNEQTSERKNERTKKWNHERKNEKMKEWRNERTQKKLERPEAKKNGN